MAQAAVREFIAAIEASPDLQVQCRGLGRDAKDLAAFTALGAASGFDFTPDEAAAFFGEAVPMEGELSDDQLAQAAGGVGEFGASLQARDLLPLRLPIASILFAASSPPSRTY